MTADAMWIPVEKQLPGKEGYYLVTATDYLSGWRYVWITWYGVFDNGKIGFHRSDVVNAWMPLPDTYENE